MFSKSVTIYIPSFRLSIKYPVSIGPVSPVFRSVRQACLLRPSFVLHVSFSLAALFKIRVKPAPQPHRAPRSWPFRWKSWYMIPFPQKPDLSVTESCAAPCRNGDKILSHFWPNGILFGQSAPWRYRARLHVLSFRRAEYYRKYVLSRLLALWRITKVADLRRRSTLAFWKGPFCAFCISCSNFRRQERGTSHKT